MARPPPLDLRLDNFNPPPQPMAKPRLPSRPIFSQLYNADWRRPVIAVACVNALRFFFSAQTAFLDGSIDKEQDLPEVGLFNGLLGFIYSIVTIIEVFGAVSCIFKRGGLIRLYTMLELICALLVTGAGIMAAYSYFTYADELVKECVALATVGKLDSKSLFRGEPWPTTTLKEEIAHERCLEAWSKESWSQILAALIFYFLPASLCYLLVFTYQTQAADPNHAAYLPGLHLRSGKPSAMYMEAYRYAPVNNGDINANARRKKRDSPTDERYQNGGPAVIPAVQSSSSYGMSPGPPSFGQSRATLLHNGRLAGGLNTGPDDDKFV